MTERPTPLGAPAPPLCDAPAPAAAPPPALPDAEAYEQRLLALLRQDHPGWRIERRPVRHRSGLVASWWWAQRREPPTEQLRAAGALGCWIVRPTGLALLAALSHQLAILQHYRN